MTITPTIGIQGGNQLLTLKDGAWIDDPRMKLFPASATAGARALRAKPIVAAGPGHPRGAGRPAGADAPPRW